MSWDAPLFSLINEELRHPALDAVLPLFSDTWLLWAILGLALVALAWRGRKQPRRALVRVLELALVMGLSAGLADMTCNVIKHSTGRLRPYQSVEGAHFSTPDRQWTVIEDVAPALGARGSSFPSAHAATTMALAGALLLLKRTGAWILLMPLCVGWSRIYVGKHFPLDVGAGWLVGAACALVVWSLYRLARKMSSRTD